MGLYLIFNIVLVSSVQKSDSIIHTHISILFQILFSSGLLQNVEQTSLCYTVGPCWLSIFNVVMCLCQSQTPDLSLPSLFPLFNHKFVLYVCESISVL